MRPRCGCGVTEKAREEEEEEEVAGLTTGVRETTVIRLTRQKATKMLRD